MGGSMFRGARNLSIRSGTIWQQVRRLRRGGCDFVQGAMTESHSINRQTVQLPVMDQANSQCHHRSGDDNAVKWTENVAQGQLLSLLSSK
jgi:hypothetical protein